MSPDLDRRLAATLADHAGGEIDPVPIVARARRRGRRLRWRRRALVGGVAACVTAGLLVTLPLAVRAPDGAAELAGSLVPPDAPNRPTALARPDLVGSDPGTVHFWTDDLVDGAEVTTWSAGRGVEQVEFHGETRRARFALARDVATLEALQQTLSSPGRPGPPTGVVVAGRPGVAWSDPWPSGAVHLWFVRWQPVDGLWAQLDSYATSRDEATAVASRVRFDRSRRCVTPFHLRSLPPGTRLLECSVTFSVPTRGGRPGGSLVVGDETGRWLTVRAQCVPAGSAGRSGDLAAGPYRVRRQGSDVLEMYVEPCVVEAFLKGWGKGYTEAEALTVLGGYQPARDLRRPDTW